MVCLQQFWGVIIENEHMRRAVLHDEKTYSDPLAFKPERFLRDGQLDPTVQDPDVVSFGSGRRIWYVQFTCIFFSPRNEIFVNSPGKSMGYDYVWLNVASILAAFDIKRPTEPDSTTVEPKLEPFGITGSVILCYLSCSRLECNDAF